MWGFTLNEMESHWGVLSKRRVDLHAKLPLWGAMKKMSYSREESRGETEGVNKRLSQPPRRDYSDGNDHDGHGRGFMVYLETN